MFFIDEETHIITPLEERFYSRIRRLSVEGEVVTATGCLDYSYGQVLIQVAVSKDQSGPETRVSSITARICLTDQEYLAVTRRKPAESGTVTLDRELCPSSQLLLKKLDSPCGPIQWVISDQPPPVVGQISSDYAGLIGKSLRMILTLNQDPEYQATIKSLPVYGDLT